MKKSRLKKGFTLVELTVAIAVIAILSAVAFGTYLGITETAKKSASNQEAKTLYNQMFLQCGLEENIGENNDLVFRHNNQGFITNKYTNSSISTFVLTSTYTSRDSNTFATYTENDVTTLTSKEVNANRQVYFFANYYSNSTSQVAMRYMAYLPSNFDTKYFTYMDLRDGSIIDEIPEGSYIMDNTPQSIGVAFSSPTSEDYLSYTIYENDDTKTPITQSIVENSIETLDDKLSFSYRLGAEVNQSSTSLTFDNRTFNVQPFVTGDLSVTVRGSESVISKLKVTSTDDVVLDQETEQNLIHTDPCVNGYDSTWFYSHGNHLDEQISDHQLKVLFDETHTLGGEEQKTTKYYKSQITVDNADATNYQYLTFDIGLSDDATLEDLTNLKKSGFSVSVDWKPTTDYKYAYLGLNTIETKDGHWGADKLPLRMVPNIKDTERFCWALLNVPLKPNEEFKTYLAGTSIYSSDTYNWVVTNTNNIHTDNSSLKNYDIYWVGETYTMNVVAPNKATYSNDTIEIKFEVDAWKNTAITNVEIYGWGSDIHGNKVEYNKSSFYDGNISSTEFGSHAISYSRDHKGLENILFYFVQNNSTHFQTVDINIANSKQNVAVKLTTTQENSNKVNVVVFYY